ncbi:cytochrome c oxidase subunit II [Jiulongibacter sediminis]|uniref:Cytochrome c oxidase subunit 2 n=1 Tax=Jiulongibacter sediminis TaxID=1605367 RepID=A0A0P7BMT7_9BACT|nr:cytochrome c oxidase subunit II [Jiulongibacter sediminis]KPM46634.1 cytochrome c oxidase subunit II [Jiulongibacter sediminis]
MTLIIGILALLFLVLTVLVIGKTQDLLKSVKGVKEVEDDSEVDGANDWNALGLMVFWVLSVVGVVWSFLDAKKDFLPEASSPHGRETDYWFWVSMAVITVAFFIVNTLLFYFPLRYKYNKNRKATFYPHNNKLEVIWTVIPALVMAGLVFTGLRVWNRVMDDAPEDAEVIEIMGRQFAWAVRYPGVDDNELGNYDYRLMDDAAGNNFGIDFTDPNSFDDFTNGTEMHIPKGKPVLLKIRARDVLHSVFIPHMRVKMDAVPGMPTKFWFVADKSTEDMRAELNNPDFNYEIACTEICGRSHFGMKLLLVVDEPEEYEAWKKEQQPFLSLNPGFVEKVPDNLKARALKYVETEDAEVAMVTEEVEVVE